jgi:peptidoglycan/LPS O-acetylase OafA/YrhL
MGGRERSGRDPAPTDPATAARRRYFPAVEGARGVAALLVLCGHFLFLTHLAGGPLRTVGEWWGRFGVVLFFGISGFLLYRPFLAARHSERSVASLTPSFLWRRAARIFPAYWVALTALTIWPGLPDVFSLHFWRYYGLIEIYEYDWRAGGLGVAWTLCVEVSFYVVLPLLAVFFAGRAAGSGNRRGIRWEAGLLAALAVASIVVYGLTTIDPATYFLTGTLIGTFSWFAWGMLLAVIQGQHPRSAPRLARFLANPLLSWPLGIAVFALMPLRILPKLGFELGVYEALQILLLGLAATLLLAPAMLGDARSLVRAVLANRAIVYLGTISYGIYLWHFPIAFWVTQADFVVTSSYPVLTAAAVIFPACLLLGTASWYLVERPIMRLARSGLAIAGSRRLRLPRRSAVTAPGEASP